jgi:transcriptional antiterminator NusG
MPGDSARGHVSQDGDLGLQPEPTQISQPAWYVIQTRSRHEAKVESILLDKHLECFLPRRTVPSRRRDRKRLLEVPLFPGYLFVHADLEPQIYYDIIKSPGVVRFLGSRAGITPVPAETVEAIRTTVASGQPYYPCPYLERGMRVQILEGPLAGVKGIILQKREKKRRLVIAVELFRRAVAVELEDEAVEPVP